MHVRHSNSNTGTLGHGGREYQAVRPGVFDVPDHVGHELIQRADWEQYFGEVSYEIKTEPEPATEETDWYDEGRKAAEAGESRAMPPGVHGRSKDGRDFLRGYDSVKKEAASAE